MPEKIALLGSTGSIGTQTLDVISRYPGKFKASVLAAGSNVNLLIKQARQFNPDSVIIGNSNHYKKIKKELQGTGIDVHAGEEALNTVIAGSDARLVVAAIVGYTGLKPVINAIKAGKRIALANKETLVVAGEIISKLLSGSGSSIIPVDSEHSAIFQCLMGEKHKDVEMITLTASGGPFLNFSREKLEKVKPRDALMHPNWNMGDKVTIDSATLMNKGLEVIEAKWLFNLKPDQIKVTIHPQSLIHSFVHFTDGSVKAQLAMPDMRIPILFALSYPHRFQSDLPRFNLGETSSLTFEEPDTVRFRNLTLAYQALTRGGNMPCILNAANEIAVKAFLEGRAGFLKMPDIVEYCMEKIPYIAAPEIESLEITDKKTRETAMDYLNKFQDKK